MKKKNSERCFHIQYESFSSVPEEVLPALFEFLNEPWEPQVLDFNRNSHDFGLQDSVIQNTRTFKPNTHTYRNWGEQDIKQGLKIAGNTLAKLGYIVV